MSCSPSQRPSLVSVIVPVHNGEDYVEQAIDSARSQTYSPLEIIVVDDGSTDRTEEIVNRIEQNDSRITFIRQERSGVASARNLAIANAAGQYIAPLDADDIWYPEKLSEQVRVMENGTQNLGLVYSWSTTVDSKSRLLGGLHANCSEGQVFANLIFGNVVGNGSTPLIARNVLDDVGYYNEEFSRRDATGCEDRDLYLRIAERYNFAAVPRVLVGYRKHSKSMSSNARTMQNSHHMFLEELQRRNVDLPSYFLRRSYAFNAMYLDNIEARNGRHFASAMHLARAAILDPGLLTETGYFKLIRVRLIQFLRYAHYLITPGAIQPDRQKARKMLENITIEQIEDKARSSIPTWKERRRTRWILAAAEWYSKNGYASTTKHGEA